MWGPRGRQGLAKALAQAYGEEKALIQLRYQARPSLQEAAQEFLQQGQLLLADGELPEILRQGFPPNGRTDPQASSESRLPERLRQGQDPNSQENLPRGKRVVEEEKWKAGESVPSKETHPVGKPGLAEQTRSSGESVAGAATPPAAKHTQEAAKPPQEEDGRRGEASAGAGQSQPVANRVLLGYRAVGVIVHRDSPLTELKLEELADIYWGRLQQWPWTLQQPGRSGQPGRIGQPDRTGQSDRTGEPGRTGLSVPGSPGLGSGSPTTASGSLAKSAAPAKAGGSGADPKIRLYGLPADSATMDLLSRRMAAWAGAAGQKPASMMRRPDTERLVQAVAADPAGVGFVDLSALSAQEGSVRLVAILPPELKGKQLPQQSEASPQPPRKSPPGPAEQSGGAAQAGGMGDLPPDRTDGEEAPLSRKPASAPSRPGDPEGREGAAGWASAGSPPAEGPGKQAAIPPDRTDGTEPPVSGKPTEPPRPDWLPPGYPLAEPVWIYVHPAASDLAKDFACTLAGIAPEELFRELRPAHLESHRRFRALSGPSQSLRSALQKEGIIPAR